MTDAGAAAPDTTQRAALGVREILRIPDYRRLLGGQAISDIGDGIVLLMLLLVIHDITGSEAAIAFMAIAEAVPAFTVGLVAGVYVDRWNRRSVMLASDLLRAVIVLLFAVAASAGIVPLLYLLGFVQASVATFFRPARGAMLPRIVSTDGLAAANSLAQGSMVIGSVIGAGIAGLVFGNLGSGIGGFAIASATYLASFALVSRLPSALGAILPGEHGAGTDAGKARNLLGSLREGLAVVRGSRALSGSLIAAAVSMLGLGAVNVLFVPLIVSDLRVDPTWMAGIEFAQTAGMLLAAGIVAILARRARPTTIITLALAGLGVLIGLLSGVTAVWQVLVILFLAGWMVTPLQAMLQTIVQASAGDAARGRVVSLLQASISTASVVSMAIGGVMGELLGIRIVYLAAAVIVLLASGIAFLLFRGVPRPSAGAAGVGAAVAPGS